MMIYNAVKLEVEITTATCKFRSMHQLVSKSSSSSPNGLISCSATWKGKEAVWIEVGRQCQDCCFRENLIWFFSPSLPVTCNHNTGSSVMFLPVEWRNSLLSPWMQPLVSRSCCQSSLSALAYRIGEMSGALWLSSKIFLTFPHCCLGLI